MSNFDKRDISREPLTEIAEILALGLLRLMAPKSSGLFGGSGESSLDFSPDQSSYPAENDRRTADE
ncbi:MAG: hypothetical protein KIT15_02330 [Xanthobacteraceae bacterium]|nr:hypothetical protein [Xanthobacteraceae bacterium]